MFNFGLFQDPKQAFQVIITSLSKFSKRQQNTASKNLASNLFMNTSMTNYATLLSINCTLPLL